MTEALPNGWTWATFADVARVDSNLVDPALYPDHPHIAPNHIESKTGRLLPYSTVREDGVTSPKHLFRPGHILYSKIRPYLAKVTLARFAGLCSADMYPISTCLVPDYLHLWLLSSEFTGFAVSKQGRSVLPKINQLDLGGLPVPVAPANEQHRIVAAIEEHFSRLDAAQDSLQASSARADALKQRILDEALFGPPVQLRELLVEPLRNGVSAKRSDSGDVRILTLTAVTQGLFTESNTKLANVTSRPVDDLWLRPGDIFVQRSNTPGLVGTAAIYRGPERWAIFPDLLVRVRVGINADPEYVALALQSRQLRRYFRQAAQGIAGSMPKISQATIEQARIPLPSIEHQKARVRAACGALDKVDRLIKVTKFSSRRAQTLRRSILSAAFSGMLVPQDPNDEPASVLLDRIGTAR